MSTQKEFVTFSSLETVDNQQISKFAIFETFFLVPFIVLPLTIIGIFYIFDYIFGIYDTSIYIYIFAMPFVSVPFLLLRTEKSTQKGLELFESIMDQENHYELYKALLILFPITTLILYYFNNDFFYSILLVYLLSFIQIFITQKRMKDKGLGILLGTIWFLYLVIDLWILLAYIILIPILMYISNKNFDSTLDSLTMFPAFILIAIGSLSLAIYSKIYATFSTFSIDSLKAIPLNYKRSLFCIDFLTLPEVLPNIEKTNLNDFKFSKILHEEDIHKLTLFLFSVTLFLPVMFYRYSIKYTALAYLPIAYLFRLKDNNIDGLITSTSLSILNKMSFWLTIVFVLISIYEFIIAGFYYIIDNINQAKIYGNTFFTNLDTLDIIRIILYISSIVLFLMINKIYYERKGKKVKPHLAKFYINLLNLSNWTSMSFTIIHFYIFVRVISS